MLYHILLRYSVALIDIRCIIISSRRRSLVLCVSSTCIGETMVRAIGGEGGVWCDCDRIDESVIGEAIHCR